MEICLPNLHPVCIQSAANRAHQKRPKSPALQRVAPQLNTRPSVRRNCTATVHRPPNPQNIPWKVKPHSRITLVTASHSCGQTLQQSMHLQDQQMCTGAAQDCSQHCFEPCVTMPWFELPRQAIYIKRQAQAPCHLSYKQGAPMTCLSFMATCTHPQHKWQQAFECLCVEQ